MQETLEFLKVALTLYWGYMRENPWLGFIITLMGMGYFVEFLRIVFRVRRAPHPAPAPLPPDRHPLVSTPRPEEPKVEGPSALERIMSDDDQIR